MRLKSLCLATMIGLAATPALSFYEVENTIVRAANEVGVPAKLLKAICFVESSFNPQAYNHSDGGGSNHAYGVCQVLINTAVQFGFNNHGCNDIIEYRMEDRTPENCKLFDPYVSALYGAKYLKYQLDRYSNKRDYALAAYNAGSARVCETGVINGRKGRKLCEIGEFINQGYVEKVKSIMKKGYHVKYNRPTIKKKEEERSPFNSKIDYGRQPQQL